MARLFEELEKRTMKAKARDDRANRLPSNPKDSSPMAESRNALWRTLIQPKWLE